MQFSNKFHLQSKYMCDDFQNYLLCLARAYKWDIYTRSISAYTLIHTNYNSYLTYTRLYKFVIQIINYSSVSSIHITTVYIKYIFTITITIFYKNRIRCDNISKKNIKKKSTIQGYFIFNNKLLLHFGVSEWAPTLETALVQQLSKY